MEDGLTESVKALEELRLQTVESSRVYGWEICRQPVVDSNRLFGAKRIANGHR